MEQNIIDQRQFFQQRQRQITVQLCPYHSDQVVSLVCIDNQCSDKLLCPSCYFYNKEHNIINQDKFIDSLNKYCQTDQTSVADLDQQILGCVDGADLMNKLICFNSQTDKLKQSLGQLHIQQIEREIDQFIDQIKSIVQQNKKILIDQYTALLNELCSQQSLSNKNFKNKACQKVINQFGKEGFVELNDCIRKLHQGKHELTFAKENLIQIYDIAWSSLQKTLSQILDKVSNSMMDVSNLFTTYENQTDNPKLIKKKQFSFLQRLRRCNFKQIMLQKNEQRRNGDLNITNNQQDEQDANRQQQANFQQQQKNNQILNKISPNTHKSPYSSQGTPNNNQIINNLSTSNLKNSHEQQQQQQGDMVILTDRQKVILKPIINLMQKSQNVSEFTIDQQQKQEQPQQQQTILSKDEKNQLDSNNKKDINNTNSINDYVLERRYQKKKSSTVYNSNQKKLYTSQANLQKGNEGQQKGGENITDYINYNEIHSQRDFLIQNQEETDKNQNLIFQNRTPSRVIAMLNLNNDYLIIALQNGTLQVWIKYPDIGLNFNLVYQQKAHQEMGALTATHTFGIFLSTGISEPDNFNVEFSSVKIWALQTNSTIIEVLQIQELHKVPITSIICLNEKYNPIKLRASTTADNNTTTIFFATHAENDCMRITQLKFNGSDYRKGKMNLVCQIDNCKAKQIQLVNDHEILGYSQKELYKWKFAINYDSVEKFKMEKVKLEPFAYIKNVIISDSLILAMSGDGQVLLYDPELKFIKEYDLYSKLREKGFGTRVNCKIINCFSYMPHKKLALLYVKLKQGDSLFLIDMEKLSIKQESQGHLKYIFMVNTLNDGSFFTFEETFLMRYWKPIQY